MLGNIFTESAGELRATIQEERQTLFFSINSAVQAFQGILNEESNPFVICSNPNSNLY